MHAHFENLVELDPGVDRIRNGDLFFTDCGIELLPLVKEGALGFPHMLRLHEIQLQHLPQHARLSIKAAGQSLELSDRPACPVIR